METTIIRGILCSGMLWLSYSLVLEKGKTHKFNRVYLLFIPFIAFIIPFYSLNISWLPNISVFVQWLGIYTLPVEAIGGNQEISYGHQVLIWLSAIYFSGVVLFLIRYIRGMTGMFKLIRNHDKIESSYITYVLIPEKTPVFSFLHYLICNREEYYKNLIPRDILQHERVHMEQRHTLDILFIEFIQTIWWFNPFIPLIKSSIKLNHEFLADKYTLNNSVGLAEYQHLLLNQLAHKDRLFTSSFNYSQTKKRIIMMNKKENFKKSAWSLIMIIPLAAIILFSFTEFNDQQIPPPPPPIPLVPSALPPPPPVEMDVPALNPNKLENPVPPPPPPVEMSTGSVSKQRTAIESQTALNYKLQWNSLLNKSTNPC